jgi:pimeloyl-ACP methyl ester carboxylesterase
VVGHSFGGCVALQFALDFPEVVHSLALLEPALMVGASAQAYRESLVRGVQRFREAGAAVVADEFLKARWPGYRSALDQMLPEGFAQAVTNAWATFELDIGLLDWHFGEAETRRITQSVLVVLGGGSVVLSPRFEETHRFLLDRLPHAEGFVFPGATHFLHLETSAAAHGIAEALADFYARNPQTT